VIRLPATEQLHCDFLRIARMIRFPDGFINLSGPGRMDAAPRDVNKVRFFIIDESSDFRRALAQMLRERWPEARVNEWDPRQQGDPSAAVAGGDYAAVLLDARPAGGDGLDWLARIRALSNAPPVVLVADHGDSHVAIKALKAGAADFMRKTGLTPRSLVRALEDAIREHEIRRQEIAGMHTPFSRTVPLQPHRIGEPIAGMPVAIPGYRTLRMIGEGGMAQVYLAERALDSQKLVLKVLGPGLRSSGTFLQRFEREYGLIASLENEYVARIYDHGFSGEHPYIAMEYLSGGTLAARIQEGMTSLSALRLTSQIAKALDAIHGRDIVHRDLKPQNIMFRENGRPVIVDFGLAKDLDATSNLTVQGEVMATPRYMSPEQCLGKPADARSDLYSLGAVFYEMIAGQKLFGNEGPAGLIYMHVHGEIPLLPEHLAGYQTIIDRLLAKRPEDRFQSARELFATIAV
jgi:FixJ family two-component response regulator/predicted Ser/Thr protein kinase